MNEWSEEECQILKTYYGQILNREICQYYLPSKNCNAIYYKAKCLGLKSQDRRGRQRQYFFNHNYFSIPNVENSYWAGYIAADGCLYKCSNKPTLTLVCKKEDVEILESFKSATGATNKINLRKSGPIKGFNSNKEYIRKEQKVLKFFNCEKWTIDLCNHWNIIPRKTGILQPPNINIDKYIIAYICGYIDGDGWITITNKNKIFSLGLVGNYDLLIWIQTNLQRFLPTLSWESKPYKHVGNCYKLSYSCNKAVSIFKFLKNQIDLPFRLNRKWNIDI